MKATTSTNLATQLPTEKLTLQNLMTLKNFRLNLLGCRKNVKFSYSKEQDGLLTLSKIA